MINNLHVWVPYGGLVHKFIYKIVGKPSVPDQLENIIKRYKRVIYNIDIISQSARLIINLIT